MNMVYEVDGVKFDQPPSEAQIKALAECHHKQLKEAAQRLEHLGQRGILQRQHLHAAIADLDHSTRQRLENIYNREMRLLQEEDHHHQAHAEAGVSVFAIFLVLFVIAAILIFSVIRLTGII